MPIWNKITLIALLLLCGSASGQDIRLPILTLPDLSQWTSKTFSNETQYQITTLEKQTVLAAVSNGTASGLFRKVKVNLLETPYLHWSWRIKNIFNGNNEKTKAGDDYPARVYVIISGGLFFWKTQTLNYVWSSHEPKGSNWPNAFTSNAMMLSIQSGDRQLNTWIKEKRNVLHDIKKYLGEENITQVDAIAIMTDSDNTQKSATAYYGDIYFSNN